MEGKIITCCGDCVYYDWKKHKCKNGHNDETNPRKHFYSDCKTLEDLEEHDAKVRADAIDELLKIKNPCDDCYMDFCESCKHNGEYAYTIQIKLEQLKENR